LEKLAERLLPRIDPQPIADLFAHRFVPPRSSIKEMPMAVPVLALLALLVRATTSLVTHPTIWLALFGWFALSRFDLGVAANQVKHSIAELWWLVALIVLTAVFNTAIKAYIQARRRRDR
jgi:hypothetical protein